MERRNLTKFAAKCGVHISAIIGRWTLLCCVQLPLP